MSGQRQTTMSSYGSNDEIDSIDSYFECITACSIDEEGADCVTRCLEVHLKAEN